MAVPEGGDMGKAQCFQHGGGFCYFVSHVFAAVAVGADGDAGAAQLPIMAQNVKVGQSHGGFMPKAGGIDFQAFAAANQFLQKLGHDVHGNEVIAGLIGQWTVAFAVIQMADDVEVVEVSDAVQDGAVVLPIDLLFGFSLKKGFLADGDAVDFMDGADDKVEGIAFQKALALRQAVPFHPDFHTGTDDQLPAVALSVLVDGVQIIVQVMDVVIFIL